MPLELIASDRTGHTAAVPAVWRAPLVQLAFAWLGALLLAAGEWAEMARQWWNASTYNHILMIPLILSWLVHMRWRELAKLSPQGWWPGWIWAGAAFGALAIGATADINLVRQAGAVMMLQAAVAAVLGPRIAWGMLFPLAYMAFLVPFGDEIVPLLQDVTAHIAVALTHLSGVPAHLDGVFIDTPVGLFEVAEACSGVKFLVAMIALGTLAAHLGFADWRRRVVFMAAAVVVPILANGVRAWGTIYIAQSQGVAFAAGFDHIVYGWIFFALVMAVLLGAAWRCFDRGAADPIIDAGQIAHAPWLSSLAALSMPGWAAVAGILLCAAAGFTVTNITGAVGADGSLAASPSRP